jgi:hypothetical protein
MVTYSLPWSIHYACSAAGEVQAPGYTCASSAQSVICQRTLVLCMTLPPVMYGPCLIHTPPRKSLLNMQLPKQITAPPPHPPGVLHSCQ